MNILKFGQLWINFCKDQSTSFYVDRNLNSFRQYKEYDSWISYGKTIFSFVESANCLSKGVAAICFSHQQSMNENSCCSLSLPAHDVVSVPSFSHSNRYMVVCHFSLHFYDVKYDVNIFICLLSTCISSFVSVFKGFLLSFSRLLVIILSLGFLLYILCKAFIRYVFCKNSPSLCLVFSFSWWNYLFAQSEKFNFNKGQHF